MKLRRVRVEFRVLIVMGLAVISAQAASRDHSAAISASDLTGKSLALETRPAPVFSLRSFGRMAADVLGPPGIGMAAADPTTRMSGNAIAKQNQMEDPAPAIANALMKDLADHYHMVPPDQVTTPETAKDGHVSAADVVLAAGTRVWGFGRRHFDISHFRFMYAMDLELTSTVTHRRLASLVCYRKPDDNTAYRQIDEWTADDGAAMKEALKAAADACLAELRAGLALPAAAPGTP
jgi:hypothetical protein